MTDDITRAFLRAELETDRRHERRLLWKALIAIAVVAALLVARVLFLS